MDTKFMIVSMKSISHITLQIGIIQIERVVKHNYLGIFMNETNDHKKEVTIRIEKARRAFMNMI